MDLSRLAKDLRLKRRERGLTLEELARRAGVSRTTLWALEKARNPDLQGRPIRVSKDRLERILAALEVSPGEHLVYLALAGFDDVPFTLVPGMADAWGGPEAPGTAAIKGDWGDADLPAEALEEIRALLDATVQELIRIIVAARSTSR